VSEPSRYNERRGKYADILAGVERIKIGTQSHDEKMGMGER